MALSFSTGLSWPDSSPTLPETVEAQVGELIGVIQLLRPDFLVRLIPKTCIGPLRAAPVLSGSSPGHTGNPNHQRVDFYSRGSPIRAPSGMDRPPIIASHPLYERIFLKYSARKNNVDSL